MYLFPLSPGCPANWNVFGGSCYTFQGPRNFQDAANVCQALNAYLVNIGSRSENVALLQFFPGFNFYIGLTDQATEGKWIVYNTGRAPTYTNWHSGQPDNYLGDQDCAMVWGVHNWITWDDVGCSAAAKFICEKGKFNEMYAKRGLFGTKIISGDC